MSPVQNCPVDSSSTLAGRYLGHPQKVLQVFGKPDKRSSQNDGNECAGITVAVDTLMGEDRRETEYSAVNLYGNRMQSAVVRATKGHPRPVRRPHVAPREYQRQEGGRDCELHVQARDFRIPHRAPEG